MSYLVSDVSGVELDPEASRSFRFTFESVQYQLDLTVEEAAEFERVVRPYVDAATRIGGRRIPEPQTQANL